MTKRKSVSKKLRFEIFKRDSFTCQYCGNTPPKIVLELDHITPVCEGGDNSEDNLITACFDCNRGKAGNKLDCAPDAISRKIEIKKEKEAQIKEYERLLRKEKRDFEKKMEKIKSIFNVNTNFTPTKEFDRTLAHFLRNLTEYEVNEAMNISLSKFDNAFNDIYLSEQALRYFCGICWNKIKGE